MDQGPVDGEHGPGMTPAAIRAELARTRDDLARHLRELKDHLLRPVSIAGPTREPHMPVTKKALTASSNGKGAKKSPAEKVRSAKTNEEHAAKTKPRPPATRESTGDAASEKRGKGEKSSPRKSSRPKAESSNSSRTASKPRKGKASKNGLVERTGEVVDTLLAGAVIGAITGAAREVADEPAAVQSEAVQPTSSLQLVDADSPGTREVLNEMASGAAMGAISGAVRAILPTEAPKAPAKARKKRESKG